MPQPLTIRPLGEMVTALARYGQRLYQPGSEAIRGITPDTWYSPLQPVKPIGPAGVEPRGFQYWAGQNLMWTPRADAEYCLSPETRVLKADLSWVAVSELRVGDALVGFEEESTDGRPRSYKKSIVTSIGIANLPCHDLIFEDSSRVRASDKHLWLAKRRQASKLEWIATKALSPVKKNDSLIRVLKPLEPWQFDDSRDAGYLAAAFDGEGHLRKNIRMGFAQKSNAMLNAVIGFLGDRNFNLTVRRRSLWDVAELEILGREEVLRFLGSIRPLRLLSKFDPDNLGELRSRNSVSIRSNTPVGNQPVITIGTSTKTLIAEGFASHNSAADLKELARYPLARIAIENVKDSIIKASWQIQMRPEPGENRKAVNKRGMGDTKLLALNRFFEAPDREHMWPDWVRPLIDDLLVIDAPAILIRRTFGGEIVELPVIRGDSIVRYIDENGFTPLPPEPAYAQNWWGIPLVNLTTNQLIYKPRNIVPRNTIASQLYGMSQTEQLAEEIQIGWDRLRFVSAYYKEGSIPGVVHVVPRGTTTETISNSMRWMNSELAGNLAARRQWRMVQGFNEPGKDDQIIFSKEPLLADIFDDMHMRKIAFGYGISPQRLQRSMNRASAEAGQEAADIEGLLPIFAWLKSLIDYIIQRKFGYPDYEMLLEPLTEPDPVKQSVMLCAYVKEGIMRRNEARERIGEEAAPEPEADMLTITTGQGAVPLGQQLAAAPKPGEEGSGNGIPGQKPAGKGPAVSEESDGGTPPDNRQPAGPRKPSSANKPNGSGKALETHAHTQTQVGGFASGTVAAPYVLQLGKFDEDQPRDPAGSETGGQWTSEGSGAGEEIKTEQGKFTDDERVYLKDYKEGGYKAIREYQMNPEGASESAKEQYKYEQEQIDSALAKSTLLADTVVYRGIQYQPLATNAENLVGKSIPIGTYQSTTSSIDVAKDYAGFGKSGVILEIKAAAGSHAISMDQFESSGTSGEHEFLFGHSGHFHVTEIDRTGKVPIIRGRLSG